MKTFKRDRSVSDDQSSSVALKQAMKARKLYCNFKFQQRSHTIWSIFAGTIVSEIRDCSDDSSFSFSSSEHQEKYRKLRELSVSNKTRCVYDGQNLLCLSKCVTDFCNGPQIDNNLISASCCGSQKYSLLILIVLILSYFSL